MNLNWEKKFNVNYIEWLFFVILPLLIFPVLVLVGIIIDSIIGDSFVIHNFMYDSKTGLLKSFISDWIASLPFSLIIAWLLFFPLYIVFGLRINNKVFRLLLTGAAIGLLQGVYFYRLDIMGIFISIIAMSLIGIIFGIFQKILKI